MTEDVPAADRQDAAVDDVSVMVEAAGALVRWRAATLVRDGAAGPAVARSWRACEGDGRPDLAPAWIWGIDPAVWRHQRSVWRPGSASASASGAVVVPVRRGAAVEAVLAFHGPDVEEPAAAAIAVLEGVATLVARDLERSASPVSRDGDAGTALQRAIALVDVFAFTVKVTAERGLEWQYFGPNSATVFGCNAAPDASLTDLVRRHAKPDDPLVEELETATLAGRPFEAELRLTGSDGVPRWVSWRTVPRVDDDGVYVDGVATDVSSRHSLGRSRRELVLANAQYAREVDLRRRHALAMREANDNVLQRLFAAGLRLQVLKRRLGDVEAHAASTIAFQLDQATTDLRELILNLNDVIEMLPDADAEDLAAS